MVESDGWGEGGMGNDGGGMMEGVGNDGGGRDGE